MRIRLFFLLLAALTPLARGTTVVPPSFADLVADADAIYRGTVTAVEPRRTASPDGTPAIKTFVTVAVENVLKGAPRHEVVLEFLGGTIDGESLVVSGMPRFKIGDREFVFVQRNGEQFCPLVAVMHGRYRVLRDASAGREYVARDNRVPLTDVTEVELPMHALPPQVQAATRASAVAQALTPAAFEARISEQVQKLEERERPN